MRGAPNNPAWALFLSVAAAVPEFLPVDVWQRYGTDWKLAARFSSPAEKKAP